MQTTNEQNITPKKEKSTFTKGFIEQLELIVIFFAIIVLLFSFVCKTCVVDGASMNNTLEDGERVIIWDMFYTPKYGDIVVIHHIDENDSNIGNKPIVKRVIGLPGDTVTIKHEENHMIVTVVNEKGSKVELLEDEYAYYDPSKNVPAYLDGKWEVGRGEVFVMGDNRYDSMDSRSLGCFDSRQILGKVIFRMTPLNKMGMVK